MASTTLPSFLPMLASPVDVLPDASQFAAEIKYDGWRALGVVENGVARLLTRAGNTIDSVPYLNAALSQLPDGTVIDGEIIDPTELDGGWNRVQSICGSDSEHVPSAADPALKLVAFDVLFLAGTDARSKPWQVRREALEALLADAPDGVTLAEVFPPTAKLLDDILTAGYEGLVVKRLDAPYSGGRSGAWVKIKPEADQSCEAQIIGFTDGKGKYAGQIGAIRFELPSGAQGQCSGMDDTLRRAMTDSPGEYIGKVVEVAHWGVTKTGKLRHPVFRRLRLDRSVADMLAAPSPLTAPASPKGASSSAKVKRPRTAKTKTSKPRTRNYSAMKDDKLLACLASLRSKSGDAYDRCINGGSGNPDGDLAVVEQLAAERGLA